MKTEVRDKVLVVTLAQQDMADPVSVHADFERFILQEGYRRISVDLSQIAEMQSLQLGCLVGLHLLAYENAVILTFDNISTKVRMLFKLLGIETLLSLHSYRPDEPGSPGRAGS